MLLLPTLQILDSHPPRAKTRPRLSFPPRRAPGTSQPHQRGPPSGSGLIDRTKQPRQCGACAKNCRQPGQLACHCLFSIARHRQLRGSTAGRIQRDAQALRCGFPSSFPSRCPRITWRPARPSHVPAADRQSEDHQLKRRLAIPNCKAWRPQTAAADGRLVRMLSL